MKYYISEHENNNASWTIEGHLLTEEEKTSAIIVEQLPVKESIEGKMAILKCKKSTNEVWYEYVVIVPSEEEGLAKLRNDMNDAVMELTMLIAMGGM